MERKTPVKTNASRRNQTPNRRQRSTVEDAQFTDFSKVDTPVTARIMRLPERQFKSFKGLKSYPNLRILDLRGSQFSLNAILVAFRSFFLTEVNGARVTEEEVSNAFQYSSVVTYALRNGMSPEISEDPIEALEQALEFLAHGKESSDYSIEDGEHKTVTIEEDAEIYSWSVLDSNFNWRSLDSKKQTIEATFISPLKCVAKGVNETVTIIPEYDNQFHVFAELVGEAVEGGIISVRAPLSSTITWRNGDDESVILEGSLVLPITANEVDKVICCDISPAPGLPVTRITTPRVRAGEFRFKSLRMQGHLIEDDEIEFEVTTTGTRATFRGVRIIRSGRHGEWENVTTIEVGEDNQEKIKYKLTKYDIGCVIRAICLMDGDCPQLMLTSSERVQPSAPTFTNQLISGTGVVGAPLFAIATYTGGIQGNCRYEWNIGEETKRNRPVVVPIKEDVGKQATCKLTPIRSDGSIGKTVVAKFPAIKDSEDDSIMEEKFLVFKKVTKNGRYQMSFVDECPESIFSIPEGETLLVSQPVDWAVVTSDQITPQGHGKTFTATSEFIKGFVVLFTDDFFVLVGQIEAASPSISNFEIVFKQDSATLTASYEYSGGIEGRSIVQWQKIDKSGEKVVGFGSNYHIGSNDRNASFRALITPISLDGKRGTTVASEPYKIKASDIVMEDDVVYKLDVPEEIYEGSHLVVATENETIPETAVRITTSVPLTNRDRVMWECNQKLLAEGIAFNPIGEDVNTEITLRIVDRMNEKDRVVVTLPPISPLPPTVEGLSLAIKDGKENKGRPTKMLCVDYDSYQGGTEGKSTIVWQALNTKEDEDEFVEVARTTRHWIEVDFIQFSLWKFKVLFIPKDSEGNEGEPIESNVIQIPNAPQKKIIDITNAYIELDPEYKHFICKVETEGSGTLEFKWGYIVDGEEQYTDEDQCQREVSEYDFKYPPFCRVQPYGENGEVGEKAIVFLSQKAENLFTPKIHDVTIVSDDKNGKIVNGATLSTRIDYEGPIEHTEEVQWERKVNNEWIVISNNEKYIANGNDVGNKLRATVAINAEIEIPDVEVEMPVFTSKPALVSANPTVTKLATALRRAKALFSGKLSIGDDVTIALEGNQFIMKSKNNVMLKDQISYINAYIDDENENQVEIKARYGYNTQVIFDKMRMKGGTKLSPSMTRELFCETLNKFKK